MTNISRKDFFKKACYSGACLCGFSYIGLSNNNLASLGFNNESQNNNKDLCREWLSILLSNINNEFDENGEIIDFTKLKFAIGDLPEIKNLSATNDEQVDDGIMLSWDDNSSISGAAPSDELCILAYCEGEIAILDSIEAVRTDGMAQVTLPFGIGVDVHVYAFFENETKTSFSNDKYAFVQV